MTTVFKNVLAPSLGTSQTTLLTTNASAVTTVIGLSITNVTSSIIQVSIQLNDTVASTTAYFANNITVPPNTSVRLINGGERLVLGPSTHVYFTSNTATSADIVMSWVEIS
jgi:hypothetical protein